ncbi:hypothetical protein GCM10028815_27590 [Mariniluteicoccus flavus]
MGLALTACSGGGAGQPTGGASSAPASRPAQQAPANQPEGAAKDIKDVKCAADPKTGEWTFTAKLTNSSDKDSEYTVKVSVIKKQGSTVVASKDAVQKVAKGQSADVKLEKFAKPAEKPDELQCVPTTTVKRA